MRARTVQQVLIAIGLSMQFAPACFSTDDVNLQAISDELKRSMSKLKTNGSSGPYYMDYYLMETQSFDVAASLGALTKRSKWTSRELYPQVRVGDYHLDNSNFVGNSDYESLNDRVDTCIDDNYDSIRRTAWRNTDIEYKGAVEDLKEKTAYLKANKITTRLDDFAVAPKVEYMRERQQLKLDEEYWTNTVRNLSKVFRAHPNIQWSYVLFSGSNSTHWMVTSEGTQIRGSKPTSLLTIGAASQADDGEFVWDSEAIYGHKPEQLPTYAVLEKRISDLADRVDQLAKAPRLDDYIGPVLFEGKAAAYLLGETIASNLSATREKDRADSPQSHDESSFIDRIGKRILPKFLSVVDDPFAKEYKGTVLTGGFEVDTEGVSAEKVSLVENGVLKALLSDRTPTKASSKSNGHCTSDKAGCSNLFVNSTHSLKRKALYDRLRQLGRLQELEDVLIVRRRAFFPISGGILETEPESNDWAQRSIIGLDPPNLVYKLNVKTGKEELVRGVDFSPLVLRCMRDIDVTGDDTAAYPWKEGDDHCADIICPSFIMPEVEFQRVSQTARSTPLIPSPLLEYNKETKQ